MGKKIRRKGYKRRAHWRRLSSGKVVRVQMTWVPASMIADKGAPGRTPASQRVLPKMEKNALGQFFQVHLKRGQKLSSKWPKNPSDLQGVQVCMHAGRRAKRKGLTVRRANAMFNVLKGYNKNSPTRTKYKIERCRQSFLTGINPKVKTSTSYGKNANVREKVMEKAKKHLGIV